MPDQPPLTLSETGIGILSIPHEFSVNLRTEAAVIIQL